MDVGRTAGSHLMSEVREELIAARRRAVAALDPLTEPVDWTGQLATLEKAAAEAGEAELAEEFRVELIAAGTNARSAGAPEEGARFDLVPDYLRTPAALGTLATRGRELDAPPLLRAHYLDLVWSLEKGPRAHPLAGREAADAYLAYAHATGVELPDADRDVMAWAKFSDSLARSAELARDTGQRDLADRSRATLQARLKQAVAERKFRLVLEPGYGLLAISKLAPDALDGLPEILVRARESFIDEGNFHLARSVVDLEIAVAKAQRRASDDIDELRRQRAESFVAEAERGAPASSSKLVSSVFIRNAIEELQKVPGSEVRIAELTTRLEGENVAALSEMKTVSAETSIPSAQVEKFIRNFTHPPIEDALALIGDHFLSDRAQEYARYDELAKKFVLTQLMSVVVTTEYGETVTLAPGTPERRNHDVFRQGQMSLGVGDMFLRQIFDRLLGKGLTAQEVISYLRECPLFTGNIQAMIEDGVARIFAGDHVAAVHLIVPQFEALLREVARTVGLPITRVQAGRSEMLLLEGLLALIRRHGVLDDRLVFTLELVFCRGGANVRNRTAHGWLQRSECTPELSNRLMQLLLAIGLLRKTERPPSA
jgi:hypothetical protein